MARSIASNALTIGVLVLMALAGVLAWGHREYSGDGPLSEAICLMVPSGASISSLSEELEARGVISSPTIFRIGADYSDQANKLKAGSTSAIAHLEGVAVGSSSRLQRLSLGSVRLMSV